MTAIYSNKQMIEKADILLATDKIILAKWGEFAGYLSGEQSLARIELAFSDTFVRLNRSQLVRASKIKKLVVAANLKDNFVYITGFPRARVPRRRLCDVLRWFKHGAPCAGIPVTVG